MAKSKTVQEDTIIKVDTPQTPQTEETVTLESLTKEQLIGVIESLSVEIEELKNSKQTFLVNPTAYTDKEMEVFYDTDEYKEGEKIAFKLSGMYAVLVNSGMSLETAMDICVNQHTYDNSIRIVREQAVKVDENQI